MLTPFHWPVEFPEVFDRANPGFDAVIGNPPFAGKNTIINGNAEHYLDWLKTLHEGAHGNADLVAHFFRRAFGLLRQGGCLGLIATNTIRQGDTRATGLRPIRKAGGTIINAQRRIKWPGEAAVVISIVHVHKGPIAGPYVLDDREVPRITAFLFHDGGDDDPARLAANAGKSYQGSIVLGMGFTFDDTDTRGVASPLAEMHRLIEKDSRNVERIFHYIGGEEVNNSPTHAHHRYVINFEDFPLERADLGTRWEEADEQQRRAWLREGVVPLDYSTSVASDWPDLLAIIRERIFGRRASHSTAPWWQFERPRVDLLRAIAALERALAINCGAQPHMPFAFKDRGPVFANTLAVIALETNAAFAALQCRVHEVWARFFASSMKDDLRYTPSDCFETFPFPPGFETDPALEAAGDAYYRFRADLMIERNKGLTKTYNLFHDRLIRDDDIRRLRELHAEMDRAVLRAYAWNDLAGRAKAIFLDETNEEEFPYQGRLFWPSDIRDEVLARLLALNAERHAEEVHAGLAPADTREEEDETLGEDDAP